MCHLSGDLKFFHGSYSCKHNYLLQDLGGEVKVQLYVPQTANIDGNLAILWVLAICTVAVGAYWAGVSNKKLM